MRAVVLSGGGSKGSYEIGVWKALRKMHIKYDIVTGTSIGALNGALMTQNTYFRALYIWNKLSLQYLFEQEPKNDTKIDILKLYGDNFIKNGGMDIKKIENIINKCVNKKKFYNSRINYGLVTYNFSTKKPLVISKKDIAEDKLIDYLMASATCYPAFQMKNIDGERYIDGGFYDNLPVNLAIELGATEAIIVDLRAPGLKKLPKGNIKATYIKPKNKISFFLDFNSKQARINMNFGYNDTMKAFDRLDGDYFTFKKNEIIKFYERNNNILSELLDTNLTKKQLLKLIEDIGKEFNLREDSIYYLNDYFRIIKDKTNSCEKITKEIEKQIKSKKISKAVNSKLITLFFLRNITNNKKENKALSIFFSKNYKQALLLSYMGVSYGE